VPRHCYSTRLMMLFLSVPCATNSAYPNAAAVARSSGPSHYMPGDGTRLLFGWMKSVVGIASSGGGRSGDRKAASSSSLQPCDTPDEGDLFQDGGDDFVSIEVDEQANLAFMAAITQRPDMASTLTSQHGLCPDCRQPVPLIDPSNQYQCARRCMYSGKWYCHSCHNNDRHVIPSMILHLGDFTPQVSEGGYCNAVSYLILPSAFSSILPVCRCFDAVINVAVVLVGSLWR